MYSLFRQLLLLSLGFIAIQANAGPDDYTHRAQIETNGQSAYWHFPLPISVYLNSQSPNLSDLRIVNAAGETLPFALTSPRANVDISEHKQALSWFPVSKDHEEIEKEAPELWVQYAQNGQILAIKPNAAKRDAEAQSAHPRWFLIDLSRLKERPTRLQIQTEGGDPFAHFTLESSDDLRHFQTLTKQGVIAHLTHQGEQIIQNEISLDGRAAKYLRLRFNAPDRAPKINEINGIFSQALRSEAPLIWHTVAAPAIDSSKKILTYQWHTTLPIKRLRFDLPQTNTVAHINVYAINQEETAPKKRLDLRQNIRSRQTNVISSPLIANALIYRLQKDDQDNQAAREVRQEEVVLSDELSGIKMSADEIGAALLLKHPPILSLGIASHEVVFLGNGAPPFTLLWGKPNATSTAQALSVLVPQRQDDSLPGKAASLAKEETPTPKTIETIPTQKPQDYRFLLWAILISGVFLLALMLRKALRKNE